MYGSHEFSSGVQMVSFQSPYIVVYPNIRFYNQDCVCTIDENSTFASSVLIALKMQSVFSFILYTAVEYLSYLQVYATGYGAGGRLGIGGVESVSTPTLLESIQHIVIRKVAVNSGGKHCLALTADGDVYSWGEGDDGKLGHGNKR